MITSFQDDFDGRNDVQVTREQVDACDDLATLRDWLDGLKEKVATIRAQVDAFHATKLTPQVGMSDGYGSVAWLMRSAKAISWAEAGIVCVKRRMRQLRVERAEPAHEVTPAYLSDVLHVTSKLAASALVGAVVISTLRERLTAADFDLFMRQVRNGLDAAMAGERLPPAQS
jgi:hypothetical protein